MYVPIRNYTFFCWYNQKVYTNARMHGIENFKIVVFIVYSTYELVILMEGCFVLCKTGHKTLYIKLVYSNFDTNPSLILQAVVSVF